MKLKLNIKQGLLYCRQNSVLKFAGGVTRIFIRFNSVKKDNGLIIEKSVKRQGNWYNYISKKYYPGIGRSELEWELLNFFEYYKANFKEEYFFIEFVIKFKNGDYRNASNMQLSCKEGYADVLTALASIFTYDYIWTCMSEPELEEFFDGETGLPIGNIIFQFKPLKGERKVRYTDFKTKGEILVREDLTVDPKFNFKLKGFIIPESMDISLWGDVIFSEDFRSGFFGKSIKIEEKNRNVTFHFNIRDFDYSVKIFIDHIKILEFKDINLSGNRDLYHFRREIIANVEGVNKEFKKRNKIEPTIYIFKDRKVVFHQKSIETAFIKPIKKQLINFEKPKIITFDIETKVYDKQEEGNSRFEEGMAPVCISFYDGVKKWSYFFNEREDLNDNLKKAFSSIMLRKYDGYRVYAHNLSNFDGIFIIDTLSCLGKLEPVIRGRRFIKLTLTFNSEGKKKRQNRLQFIDSLQLLPNSLHKLCKSFGVETTKSYFPIKIMGDVDFPLDYKGVVPNIDLFPETSDINVKQGYNEYCMKFKEQDWCFKDELIKYCETDTVALYQVLKKFQQEIFLLFYVDVTRFPTLSSLAFAIFRSNFLESTFDIPILQGKVFRQIRSSYFGGITEVYKPVGKDINSYDVNSLYPFAMKTFDMPLGNPQYVYGDIRENNINLEKIIGFFKVRVYAPENLKNPILPFRTDVPGAGKRTLFPLGKWDCWYLSEEILNAEKYGYKFDIIEGYIFKRGKIFTKYVDALYKIKTSVDKDDPKYFISKLLLNSLYGRFGLTPIFEKSVICSDEEGDKIIQTRDQVKVTPLLSGNVLITYIDDNDTKVKNISIGISAAISAYSRVKMSYFIIKYAEHLYYIDTDGIKIDCKLSDDDISEKEIGKMKFEYTLSEFTCLAPKVYGGIFKTPYKNSTEIVKVKGFKSPLKYSDLVKCLKKGEKLDLKHVKWYRDLSNSTILIGNEGYTLGVTEAKRKVIYDINGNFVDTEPLVMDNKLE